ncbi:hypothetical protein NXS19_000293 [Fusarium pseudograminearum]|nr:hypothetical protein NXS19_000293 [Fusarium pseudograminearum]
MSQDLKELQTLESNGYITVAFLPLIFVPGSLVLIPNRLAGSKEVFCAAVVEVCKLIEENQKKFWYVRLAYTNFDNVQFGATSTKAQYPQFDDVKHILDLPVFPMKYHPNRDQIYQSLLERGSRCKQLHLESSPFIGHGSRGASGTHWEYDGPFWSILSGGGLSPGRSETEEGRSCINIFQGFPTSLCQGKIIIDPNSLIKENPGCREVVQKAKSGPISIMWKAETTSSHDLDTSKSKPPYQQFSNNEHQANSLTDLQLITMAPILAGFSLTRRSWGFFLVDNIADIRWNDDSYGNLQIDQSRKDIIYEVVKEHRKAPVALDNVVAGKGAGLIFLLHGPPGSGKTMTAECVAESLHCPLYHTTMGELGPNVKAIEEQLQITFTRIQQWSAILLFDEADAFMAERSENDLERNALVSVFLRLLEYQSGILFLTTNRLGDFDKAFFSRIDMSLEFQKPDLTQRTLIWKQLAAKLAHGIYDEEFEKLGKWDIDGRRIKNVLKVALLLTKARKQGTGDLLTYDTVVQALDIAAQTPGDKGETDPRGRSGVQHPKTG